MTTLYACITARPALALPPWLPGRCLLPRAWILGMLILAPVIACAAEPSLYDRVKGGTSCEQTTDNGRYCEYKIDGAFEIGIKDVGGAHTVVGFRHSNVDAELYAVLYGGCIAIVPGKGNKSAKHRDYGVFISPKTGEVYRASVQCEESLK